MLSTDRFLLPLFLATFLQAADPNQILGHSYAFLIAAKYGAMLPERNLVFINDTSRKQPIEDFEKQFQSPSIHDAIIVFVPQTSAPSRLVGRSRCPYEP